MNALIESPTPVSVEKKNQLLKAAVVSFYDLQQLRIQVGLRLVANVKVRLGQEPGKKETTINSEAQHILSALRKKYERISDAVALGRKRRPRKKIITEGQVLEADPKEEKNKFLGLILQDDGILTDEVEIGLVETYLTLEQREGVSKRDIERALEQFPIYVQYLKHMRGIGPLTSGILITHLDIHRAPHPSSFWRKIGFDVAADGRGRGRYKEHLEEIHYIDKNGHEAVRQGLRHNPWLKSKMVILCRPLLNPTKGNPRYRAIYDKYKEKITNDPRNQDKSGYELRLIPQTYSLPIEGQCLAVVAVMDGKLHVRMFDEHRKKVIDLTERDLPADKKEEGREFIQRMSEIEQPEKLGKKEKGKIITEAAALAGHVAKAKGHLDNMAKRYMLKRFLIDLHTRWREIEGLPRLLSYTDRTEALEICREMPNDQLLEVLVAGHGGKPLPANPEIQLGKAEWGRLFTGDNQKMTQPYFDFIYEHACKHLGAGKVDAALESK